MTGIEARHSKTCRSRKDERCNCQPTYRAEAYDKRADKRIRKTFPTMAAAKAWRQDAQVALRRGTLRASDGRTVADTADAWLKAARRGEIRNRSGDPYKPSVIRAYEQNLRLRVIPAIGAKKLHTLRRTELQDLGDRLTADGLSPATVMTALLPMRAIYRRAVARGDLDVNPTRGLEMPAIRSAPEHIAAPVEAAALLDALDADQRALWATAFYTGLRRGELTALRWNTVDLAAGMIRVEHGWDHFEGEIARRAAKASAPSQSPQSCATC